MAAPTLNQSSHSSPNSSTTAGEKKPAIRVLAGPLRLTPSRLFPILLNPSDPLVQESETQDAHIITFVSPQALQQDPTCVNGVAVWTSWLKGRLSAVAMHAMARLRRVLDHE